MKDLVLTVLLCFAVGTAVAQGAPKATQHAPAHKAAATGLRTECVEAVGLCVGVPSAWQRLGNIFDDLGFVVAEQHVGEDSATWPQISVAAIDVPTSKSGATPSLDALVDVVLAPDGTFTRSETQQRSRLLLNGAEAEVLRVLLRDESKQTESLEEVALIQGEDGMVYSIALRCAPQELERLDPVFQKTIRSWKLKPVPEPETPPSKPAEDTKQK